MTDRTPARFGRRALLLAGGGALAAAGLAQAAPAAAHAAPTGRHGSPPHRPFDLTRPATALFRAKPLHNNTVLQSFAFDDHNRRLYAVQLMAGGQQLPDEPAPVSGATRAANGDLCLTQLDPAGNETGHMFLKGFGHGVQIGVEPHRSGAYLWTEVASDNYGGTNGWGQHLGRFRFADGAVLTASDPRIRQVALIPGTDHTTVSVNVREDLLLVRYARSGVFHYALFRLSEVNRGRCRVLTDIAQPTLPGTFQGFTFSGGNLYLLTGDAYGAAGSVSPVGNTHISRVDLRTGGIVADSLIEAGADLLFREPEGMAVATPDPRRPGNLRLCWGFASTVSSTDTAKLASVYYQDQRG
ncbi:phage baseplate protein [Rugosimonospora africana]|uniref:P68 RBP/TagC-like beta-propeller domain-containing protein n=1 Tax=Rugosimonospora africana TaxID=556532 RepID=A0A8J3VRS8_9ACTN|nr:hypothetical protein [Rugosimonospora africana]GIH15791.1 hypothetical protein Raf01_39630 [Rugosimonospora africana]